MEIRGGPLKARLLQAYRQDPALCELSFLLIYNPAIKEAESYVKSVKKLLDELAVRYVLQEVASFKETSFHLEDLHDFTAVLVAHPLGFAGEEKICELIPPSVDVDMQTATSAGLLLQKNDDYLPATARAVKSLLEDLRYPLIGKRALVVGRSRTVGSPIAQYLLNEDATVTIAHSRTPLAQLKSLARESEIIVLATGKQLLEPDDISPGTLIIDCGFDAAKHGDLGFKPTDSSYTPVPGGIGPLTTISLVTNALFLLKNKLH